MSLTLNPNISPCFFRILRSKTSLHLNIWKCYILARWVFFSRLFGEIPFGIAQKLRHSTVAAILTQRLVSCSRRCKVKIVMEHLSLTSLGLLHEWQSQVRERFLLNSIKISREEYKVNLQFIQIGLKAKREIGALLSIKYSSRKPLQALRRPVRHERKSCLNNS